ncbi:Gfo/Idh/MocA family oxidoreductase [Flavobacteriaceae bacterium]|nr:Gfo/Idh/MocA family oxidoreductase [Flavobacteriaceae bacterium]
MDGLPISVLVIGCGNMGASHAKAYEQHPGFAICGLVSRGSSKKELNQTLIADYTLFADYQAALEATKPDAVCISTYPDTHEAIALKALEMGCHLFVEKPLATTVEGCNRIIEVAKSMGKQVVVGYILRHHPTWIKFIATAHQLGKPLVMRMNLNQQSQGYMWEVHKNLMQSLSPIVDCGVHYLDVMCQMTQAKPVSVSAIGVRLSADVPVDNYNYGQLQIRFDDGSVGWYEAGWGPMMSETAFFIKDVIGPKGSASIISEEGLYNDGSDEIERHTKSNTIRWHHSSMNEKNEFNKADDFIRFEDDPSHQQLCNNEQDFFYRAIQNRLNLEQHLNDAVNSLQIVLACDQAVRLQKTISL